MAKTALGQTVPLRCSGELDAICRFALEDDRLLLVREEYAKAGEVLFDIPFSNIRQLSCERESKSAAGKIALASAALLAGAVFLSRNDRRPECVTLEFYDPAAGEVSLLFEMLPPGENKIVKTFERMYARWRERGE